MQQRGLPLGIVLCALAMGIMGILTVIVGLPLLAMPQFNTWGWFFLLYGVFSLASTYGLFRLLPWAWGLTVTLNVLGFIADFIIPSPPELSETPTTPLDIVLSYLIPIAIVLYLLRPSVRARFRPTG